MNHYICKINLAFYGILGIFFFGAIWSDDEVCMESPQKYTSRNYRPYVVPSDVYHPYPLMARLPWPFGGVLELSIVIFAKFKHFAF